MRVESSAWMGVTNPRQRRTWVASNAIWYNSLKRLERVKGIEPSSSAWKAVALPLSYTRGTRRTFTNDTARRAKVGGRGRTRTYEGIASGFKVLPLSFISL